MNNYELKQQRERELFSKNIYEMDECELNVIEMDLEQLIREDYSLTREDEMEQQVFQVLDEVKRLNGTKPHGTKDDLTYLFSGAGINNNTWGYEVDQIKIYNIIFS